MERGENVYRKKECDLCGNYAFEKYLGTAKVLDGGYTRVENFEKSGFGAIVINYWEIDTVKDIRIDISLCPDCARKIDVAIYQAINALKTKKETAGEE